MGDSLVRLNFGDGEPVLAWTSMTHRETFSDPIGSLEFTAQPLEPDVRQYAEKLQKGELCALLVDGKPQAAMLVETVDTEVSPDGGVSFSVKASTPLKNIFQAEIDPKFFRKLQADTPLLDLVAEVLEPFGVGEVIVEDDVAVIRTKTGKNPKATPTAKLKIKKGEIQGNSNETVYGFLARVLTRLGVMLRMDAVIGSCYITAPHYDGEALYGCKQSLATTGPSGLDRFFGKVTIHDSNDRQFSFCEVYGNQSQQSGETFSGPPNARVLSTDINKQRPPYRAIEAFAHKPAFRTSKSCKDNVQARSHGKMVLGLEAQYAFYVKGTVDGLVSMTGAPWTVDTLGRVVIEAVGFDEQMWLAERTMSADARGGQQTELVWIPPGNFVIGEAGAS